MSSKERARSKTLNSINAIISVSDPSRLDVLGKALKAMEANVYATGGTQAKLQALGVDAHSISDLTGFPEILGGRVKTLHPAVHSGILAKRDDAGQMSQLREHDLKTIELVVSNLYPFASTIAKEGVTLHEAVEQIDVGGPTMIRASAKNFTSVVILCDPADYEPVMSRVAGYGRCERSNAEKAGGKGVPACL